MTPAATPERPWLGLTPFSDADASYFSGRTAEIGELCDRVVRATLTVLYGVSGYGKSSLLNAGVIPALRASGHAPICLPRFTFDDPARPPLSQAITAIAVGVAAGQVDGSAASLWECFHTRIDSTSGTEPAHVRPVLILDQFEEVFTLGEDKGGTAADAAHRFLTDLADLVENRPPAALEERLRSNRDVGRRFDFESRPVSVLIALREDFIARLERWRRIMPSLVENRLELRPLGGRAAMRAILDPAKMRPNKASIVDERTAEALVRFIAGNADDTPLERIENVPPLLSLICAQLNERRFASPADDEPERDDIPMQWVHRDTSDDPHVGPTRGHRTAAEDVFENFYRGALSTFPDAVQNFVEDQLVSDAGFRETVAVDTALAKLTQAGVPSPRAAIAQLVDQRLLAVEERGGVSRLELTHDILCKPALRHRADRREREAVAATEAAESALKEEERRRIDAVRLRDKAIASRRYASVFALVMVVALVLAVSQWRGAIAQRRVTERVATQAEKEAGRSKRKAQRAKAALAKATAAETARLSAERERGVAEEGRLVAKSAATKLTLEKKAYEFCSLLASAQPRFGEDFWAPRVRYLGRMVSRSDVLNQLRNDKRLYGTNFCTVTSTPVVTLGTAESATLTFPFEYALVSPNGQPAARFGHGTITLQLDKNGQVYSYEKAATGGHG